MIIELGNMLTVAEMVLKAALLRTESRGGHYREAIIRKKDVNGSRIYLFIMIPGI
ncbi:hypothetical protein ACFL7M_12665 [Thermodesulfobacteriota bacterium]